MSKYKLYRRSVAFLVFSLIWILAGCQHTIDIKEKSDGSESFTPLAVEPAGGVPLGYLKTVKVLSNGVEYPPSNSLLYRIRNKLLETKLFYDITSNRPPINHIELNLTVSETEEKYAGKNLAKGIASGATLGLLLPIFPQYQEYSSKYSLSITNLEGEKKEYEAFSHGSLEGSSGEGSLGRKHLGELHQTIHNNNLNSLMSQLLNDIKFILMPKTESPQKFES